ncbi:MAG TPA: MraY family glycosyltransferase [Acidimicrobiia bacterium]|nr:MraY family glycosyltransferase [Acidimicrobiia bacterium]
MGGYLVVFGVAAAITFVCTPLVRRVAFRVGALSQPSDRTVHTKPMPTVGGAAMFVGFLAAMGVASRLPQFREMFHGSSEPAGVILAGGVMFAVGALDDLREVSPPAKLAGQVLSGSILSLMGVSMLFFRVPFFDIVVLSPDLAPLVTVLTVVLFANAINLIDGLDGLAAGIVAIAGMAVFLYSDRLFKDGFLTGANIAPLIAMIAVGICVGFLPWNFSPARIFMGDAGAMFLGLLMAVTTITIGGRADYEYSGQTFFFFAPLFIPLVILGVPLVDTVFSVVRRVVKRRSFAIADKDHLHHRLVRLGHGPRRSVVMLWLWTALLSGLALIPLYTDEGNAYVPVGLLALALGLYAFFHPGRRSARDARGRELAGPEDGSTGGSTGESTGESDAETSPVVDLEARRRRA